MKVERERKLEESIFLGKCFRFGSSFFFWGLFGCWTWIQAIFTSAVSQIPENLLYFSTDAALYIVSPPPPPLLSAPSSIPLLLSLLLWKRRWLRYYH